MTKLIIPSHKGHLLLPKEPLHHSVSDWDFNATANWYLDPDTYVSAPKSLRLGGVAPPTTYFLCKIAATLNLPQGRIHTYHRFHATALPGIIVFRNQYTPGANRYWKLYYVKFTPSQWQLWVTIEGANTLLASQSQTTLVDTWYLDRVTWWNGLTAEGQDALTVMVERYLADEWFQQGEWLYDTNNRWKNEPQNRCGIGTIEEADYMWFDDTEIWGPL